MYYFICGVFILILKVFLLSRDGEFNKDYDRKATFKVCFTICLV